MKEKFLILFLVIFVFLPTRIYAAGLSGSLMIEETDLEKLTNVTQKEKANYRIEIKTKLEENLDEYLDFRIVGNFSDIDKLKQIQARQESDNYFVDSDLNEIGIGLSAAYRIVSTVSGSGKSFRLSVTLENINSGERNSVTSGNYASLEELISSPSAVDEITIKLADKIGIRLSDKEREKLKTGTANWDNDSKLEDAQNRRKKYEERIASLKKEMANITDNTDLGKTSKADLQRKIDAANIKKEQAEKEELEYKQKIELLKKEEMNEKTRSLENRNRINQLETLIQTTETRSTEVQSIYKVYKVIEEKKKLLLKVEAEIVSEKKNTDAKMQEEIKKERNAIMNAEARTAEKSFDGQLIKEAVDARTKKADEAEKQIRAKYENQYKEWLAIQNESKEVMISDIIDGYEELANTKFSFSSVNNKNELHATVYNFDGNLMSWPVVLDIYSENESLGTIQTLVSFNDLYEAIEGKPAPEKLSDEYYNAVDVYTSLFVQEKDLLNFEIECMAAPQDSKLSTAYSMGYTNVAPSRYLLIIEKLQVSLNLGNNKTVLKGQTEFPQIIKTNKSSKAWMYTFTGAPQNVESLIYGELKRREDARKALAIEMEMQKKAEEDRLKAEEAERERQRIIAEKEAKKAEKKQRKEERTLQIKNEKTGRQGLYLDVLMCHDPMISVLALHEFNPYFSLGGDIGGTFFYLSEDQVHIKQAVDRNPSMEQDWHLDMGEYSHNQVKVSYFNLNLRADAGIPIKLFYLYGFGGAGAYVTHVAGTTGYGDKVKGGLSLEGGAGADIRLIRKRLSLGVMGKVWFFVPDTVMVGGGISCGWHF